MAAGFATMTLGITHATAGIVALRRFGSGQWMPGSPSHPTQESRARANGPYFFNDFTKATKALISSSESFSLNGFILSLSPSFRPSLIEVNIFSSFRVS